ncbi:elongation of very long chain fatty acids protein 4-like [Danaus plexippus]|uniref:elongation of very long chain fatty acids protein 4-like n=1 Tax=Danaus plexippus TaxID=13037 RepID=UPI002AB324E9|nr:elongation of very long chain fatty acids protein 4-like [Danaus plexippus]
MALILKGAVKLYYYLNDDIADQRVQNWPLMRTPWPGVALLAIYLLTVLKWIPKYMEKRPAFDLRRILFVYNFIQVLLCIYVTYQSLKLGWLNNYSLFCQPLENTPEADEYAWKVCYVYFCIKLTDLFDTLFFVLRKKQNQVSFLHVYHHWGMVAVSWSMVKWLPGGHTSLLVPINSIVHIIMYTYYMLTTWDDAYKKSLWWKKYVTQIQIIQFTLLLIHFTALVLIEDCPFPRVPSYILIPQNLFMVLLFSEFYYRSYIKTPTVKNK